VGERCHCGASAEHKVEEVVLANEIPLSAAMTAEQFAHITRRHPLTTYLCHAHFREIMGPAADRGRHE